jgi:multiple antibiotic resistance protein
VIDAAEYASIAYVFVTLLAMVNPLEAAGAYSALMQDRSEVDRLAIARKACVAGLIILIGFGMIGDALLGALGISIDAFKIAGGLLLLAVGYNMVFAEQTDTDTAEKEKPVQRDDPSIFPLAIPIITGPGALTAAVTLFGRAHKHPVVDDLAIAVLAVIVFAITYVAMVGSNNLQRILGKSGIEALSRIVGIIVAAIAIQLVIDGSLDVVKPLFAGRV